MHIQWIEEAEAWLNRFNPAYVPSDLDYARKPVIAARCQKPAGNGTKGGK